MRIAYLVSQYPSVTHTFVLREIRTLKDQGWDVRTFSILSNAVRTNTRTAVEEEEARNTPCIRDLSAISILGCHLAALLTRPHAYLWGLWQAIRLGRARGVETLKSLRHFIDAVVAGRWMMQAGCTHFHTHFSSAVALLIVKIFSIEYSVTIHGPDEFTDPSGFNLAHKVNSARLVVTISSFGFSQTLRFSDPRDWPKIAVSRLGVDPSFFDPRPEPATSPKEILCVARLAPVKAQRILLQAAGVLAHEGREFKLRFVGDGPDRRDLERMTQDLGLTEHVVFDGWLNEEAVRQRYRSASIFSLASFAEGLPVVLMEAMAMEIPCVAPAIMGIPELIRDGENGLLVPPADHVALARALARLLDDSQLRKELGAAARHSVLSDYDLATNVGDFVAKLAAAVR